MLLQPSNLERFEQWRDFLTHLSLQPRRVGVVGQAAALKLALNQLIVAHAISFSLSLGMTRANGIADEAFMDILRQSALYAPMFDKKLPNWTAHQYTNPNFSIKHLLKDVELVKREAGRQGLAMGLVQTEVNLLQQAMAQGLAEADYSAILEVVLKGANDEV